MNLLDSLSRGGEERVGRRILPAIGRREKTQQGPMKKGGSPSLPVHRKKDRLYGSWDEGNKDEGKEGDRVHIVERGKE